MPVPLRPLLSGIHGSGRRRTVNHHVFRRPMKPTELTSWQALQRSVAMVFRAAPTELRNLAGLNLLTGVGPSVSLFLGKIVIDETSRIVATGGVENPMAVLVSEPKLLWSVAIALGLNLIVDSVDSLGITFFAALRDRIQGYCQGIVLHKVACFDDIALFETPDLLNLLELTEKGLPRMQRLAMIAAAIMTGIFTFIPSILVSFSIVWWVPVVLLAAAIPSVFVEIRYNKKSWRVEETQAGITRKMNIYAKSVTAAAYAKEVRLFSLQQVLLDRWRGLFQQMFETMQAVRYEGAFAVVLWAFIGGLGVALPYVYVVLGVVGGTYTLGDLALYTGIIFQLRRSLYILIGNIGDIYDVSLATAPIFQLLDLHPQLVTGTQALAQPSSVPSDRQGLRIEQVSFQYPGSHRPTLEHIDLAIHPGEMVALVGENGAGKTTLAKLLCRLYDPSQGRVLWHGQDFRSLSLAALRSRIAVVMQDYARFPASLRENVGWGYLPQLQADGMLKTALDEAGIATLLTELDQGLETPLGKELEHGTDLSGGQWQRVAIARSLMRLAEAELLVFDEPTAALDPKNEQEIYSIFRAIAQGRMAVVVSHRLALAKMCDRIIVLEHGRIIESGSHDQLMALGGQYQLMFSRQASSYL
jgi:ATP-binding cassette subfamily B protein